MAGFKWEMNPNSLFAVLLRSQWWISFAVAAGIFMLAKLLIPDKYVIYAFAVPLPFVVIGCIAAWRQFQAPSASRIAETAEAARAMSFADFSAAVEQAYRAQGFTVTRFNGSAADLQLTNNYGRVTLVSCKRWKAARTGVEPLRELFDAKEALEAFECVYVVAGEVTENALKFAAAKRIRLVSGAALVTLLPRLPRPTKSTT
jgi:restriction system protein